MKKVFDYLAANRERFIQELGEHVRFPSVSAQPQHKAEVLACAQWLTGRCQRAGLQAELCTTAGHPIVLARTPRQAGKKKPHYLVYGHYDVQPAEPLELWHSAPFEPTVRGQAMFGRGTSDNKGQHLAHLNAVEAYLKTGTELPCDLTFVLEGEEEVGSSSLPAFLREKKAELACEAIVVSDTGMPDKKHPALTCGLRGIAAFEVKLTGPSRDLHSGLYGGTVKNPAMALCQLLAGVHDKNGRVTIPGFYDDVQPLSRYERQQMARLPFSAGAFAKFLGVKELFGEKGFTTTERRSARPTFEINGLTSGYQGQGSKTIIPSWASAKVTMRLVPNQKPAKIIKLATAYLKQHCPPGARLEITGGHGGEAYYVSPTSPGAMAALRALEAAFECKPVLLREGGSIPIVNEFKRILGADTLLLGLALPDDNAHSPNEKFDLDCFERGMKMSAILWQELGK